MNKVIHKAKEPPWTEQEIAYLYEHYPSERAIDVARSLKRSKSAVQHKACRMGIHKDDGFSKVRSETMKACHPRMNRKMTSKGYVVRYVPDHPYARSGYVMEHRLVVEDYIGKFLSPDMDVHHKNGIKTDNRIENLAVMTHAEHTAFHNKGGRA